MNSSVLSTTIAQTQMDETRRPIITPFTTIWADQNKPQIERSAETSGAAPAGAGSSDDCASAAANGTLTSSATRRNGTTRRRADCATLIDFIAFVLPASFPARSF